jgi:hypothetical protein
MAFGVLVVEAYSPIGSRPAAYPQQVIDLVSELAPGQYRVAHRRRGRNIWFVNAKLVASSSGRRRGRRRFRIVRRWTRSHAMASNLTSMLAGLFLGVAGCCICVCWIFPNPDEDEDDSSEHWESNARPLTGA